MSTLTLDSADETEAAATPTTRDHEYPAKRRMPEKLRRFLIKVQGGKMYLPAAYRLVWFRDECADWGVSTTLVEGGYADGFATVQAVVYNSDGRIIASGLKTESKADFPAGWVEKAETGSIARALAVAGFGTQFTPELDNDIEGASDHETTSLSEPGHTGHSTASNGHAAAGPPIYDGPDLCPICHAPSGKRHGKSCASI